jgi:hypothetical protein
LSAGLLDIITSKTVQTWGGKLIMRGVGFGKRILSRGTVRPGIGSVVKKGPLKVGKQVIYGKPAVTTAARIAKVVGVGAAGVGVATVASHRQARKPATAPSPRRSAPTPTPTATSGRKCCPVGTKRMACFKRDVDPVAESKRKARARTKKARAIKRGRKSARRQSAKQKAARARFAAAARKGPIRKGARL